MHRSKCCTSQVLVAGVENPDSEIQHQLPWQSHHAAVGPDCGGDDVDGHPLHEAGAQCALGYSKELELFLTDDSF